MRDGVKQANVFVCCLTNEYVKSDNCLTELKHAADEGKHIIPVILEGYGAGKPRGSEGARRWRKKMPTTGSASRIRRTSLS